MAFSVYDSLAPLWSEVEQKARFAGRSYSRERDWLLVLAESSRLFTYPDTLLKQLGLQPAKIKKGLKRQLKKERLLHQAEAKQLAAEHAEPWPIEHDPLVQSVVAYAQQRVQLAGATASAPRSPERQQPLHIQLSDLLVVLLSSDEDEAVLGLQTQALSPAKIETTAQAVQQRPWPRLLLLFTRETLEILGLVLLFLVLIRQGIGEPRLIPSPSMVPTLQIEDRVFVEKLSHWVRPYQRGDVVVFYPPQTQLPGDPLSVLLRWSGISGLVYDKEDNIDVAYIKRLIGEPGDTIEVLPGSGVLINGELLNEPYVNELAYTCTREEPALYCGPYTIPPGEVFVMGDNRNASADSRYWGTLPQERIIGRAVFRFWPFNRLGTLEGPADN